MTQRTILIADDEPHTAHALAELVESAGYRVVGKATTGEETVLLNETLSPDVVILDILLSGEIDGLQAADIMMKTRPVPVVVCTARYDDRSLDCASRIGAYAYITKPCRSMDLLPAINLAIERFEESKTLKEEVRNLKQALEDRKIVEQAKGIVMHTYQMTECEAHRFLQHESQRQRKSLPELAQSILLADKTPSDTTRNPPPENIT